MYKTTKILYDEIKTFGKRLNNFNTMILFEENAKQEIVDDIISNILHTLDVNVKYIGDNTNIVIMEHGKFIVDNFSNRKLTIPLKLNKDININFEEVYAKIRGMVAEKMMNDSLFAITVASGIYKSINVTFNIQPEPNVIERFLISDLRHANQRMHLTELSLHP